MVRVNRVAQAAKGRTHTRTTKTGATYQQRGKAKANGEGAIYERIEKRTRTDGSVTLRERWAAAVTLPTGQRKVLYGRTREDVAKKLTQALAAREGGIAPPSRRETVGSWLVQYVADLETRGVASGTVTRYRGILTHHLAPALGRLKLAELQPHHVQQYQATLLGRGVSPSSLGLHRSLLGGALKQAVAFGLLPRNVVPLVKPPREAQESKGRTLTPADARRFLDRVHADRLAAYYVLLLTAGLRRGEALGLRWADLALDGPHPTLHVRQQLQWPKGVPTLVPLKSRKGVRAIPLPRGTVEALRRRQALQDEERALVGEAAWRTDGLVFNAEDGAPLHRNTIGHQFQRHARAAGLLPLRQHDLRHTYGSLLMSQGVPLKTISELLGHAAIEVTANVYLHSLDVQVRDTARSVELALAAPARSGSAGPREVCPTCGQALPSRSA